MLVCPHTFARQALRSLRWLSNVRDQLSLRRSHAELPQYDLIVCSASASSAHNGPSIGSPSAHITNRASFPVLPNSEASRTSIITRRWFGSFGLSSLWHIE